MRLALTHPEPLPEWVQHDQSEGHRNADRIAQATVLADFMSSWGEQGGLESVQYVLRRWGQHGLSIESGRALGQLWEWPPSLSRTETRFEAVRSRLGDTDLNARLEVIALGDNAADLGRRFIEGFATPLQQAIGEVEACTDFVQPRAKLEMLLNMQAMLRQVNAARRRFERMVNRRSSFERPAGDLSQAELAAPQPERLYSGGDDPAPPQRDPDVQGRLRDEVQTIEHFLEGAKQLEQTKFAEARSVLPRPFGALSGGAWDILVHVNGPRAADIMRGLADSHVVWIEKINRLRELLRSSGDPPTSWPVKPAAADPARRLDPDVETTAQLYLGAEQQQSYYGLFDYVYESTANQWRARGRY